jgi:hypothetical protein
MDVPDAEEVLRLLGPTAALSHETAARRLGIELVEDAGTQRVTVPRNRSRRCVDGWVVVRHDLSAEQVIVRDGHRLTPAGQTVRDLARVLPTTSAADSALRKDLIQEAQLRTLLAGANGRGAAGVRVVGRLLDGQSGSVLESIFRVLAILAGLPAPLSQYPIRNETGVVVARVDFCWPAARLVVELDGFAFHSDRASYRRDRWRMNELERLGWRVLRITWEDVQAHPEVVLALVNECLTPPDGQ